MLGALSPLRLLSLNVSDVCTELADNKLVGRMGGGGRGGGDVFKGDLPAGQPPSLN